jgi:hypothetical protein
MMPIDPAVKKPYEYSSYICAVVVRDRQQDSARVQLRRYSLAFLLFQ